VFVDLLHLRFGERMPAQLDQDHQLPGPPSRVRLADEIGGIGRREWSERRHVDVGSAAAAGDHGAEHTELLAGRAAVDVGDPEKESANGSTSASSMMLVTVLSWPLLARSSPSLRPR
jgi:hypothetical protein